MEQNLTREQADLRSVEARRGLRAAIAGTAAIRAGGAAIGLMLQLFEAALGVPPQFVGFIGVAFYLSELSAAPFFGTWVDRRGWRPFMLLGPLLAVAAVVLTRLTALLSLTLALPILFATRLMEGLAVASNTPATLSFLAAAAGDNAGLRARSSGYFQIAVIGGSALGGLMGGLLYDRMGAGGFTALAIFYLLCWAIFLLVPARLPGQSVSEAHPNPLGLLRQRTLWSFAPAWIAINGVLGVWLNNFAYQLTLPCIAPPTPQIAALCVRTGNQLLVGDFGENTAGLIFAGFAIIFSLGIVLWSLILPRMQSSSVMLIASGGGALVSLALFLINRLSHEQPGTLVALGSLLVLALLTLSGFMPAALAILMELAERNASDRGAVMGAYSVLLGIGQFLGGALGGFAAAAAGVDGLNTLTLVFILIAALFVWITRQQNRHNSTNTSPPSSLTG